MLSLAGACALFAALAATACAQTQGSWTMKAPIPLARNEVALAAVGGKVHVIGGGIKGVAGTYHDEYDPATDRWRTRAPLPFGRKPDWTTEPTPDASSIAASHLSCPRRRASSNARRCELTEDRHAGGYWIPAFAGMTHPVIAGPRTIG